MSDSDLGRGHRAAEHAAELFEKLTKTTEPRIHALVGEWGSGKSWMLERVVEELENRTRETQANIVMVRFNPWFYSDQNSLFVGFSTFLLQQTLRRRDVKRDAGKLLAIVGPSLRFPFVDLTSAASLIGESLSSDAPGAIRAAVGKGLEDQDKQIVVIMDDMDRLNPDELLMLFKLIRLVGDVPRLHYLLAYDEETLHHLLERTEIAQNSPERARRYLEKIVERRWEVPPLTAGQLERLVLRKLPLTADSDQTSDPGLGYRLEGILHRTIFTPRAAERFVAAVVQVPADTRREMHQRDLYLAMYLRTFFPQTWALLLRNQDILFSRRVAHHPRREEPSPQALVLESALRESIPRTSIREEVIELIKGAFPSFNTALNPRHQREAEMPRMGHPDSFGRYVWLGIPPGDLSDAFVLENLRQLPGISAVFNLHIQIQEAPSLLISAIRRIALSSAEGLRKVHVYAYLESAYKQHEVDDRVDFFFSVNDRLSSAGLALIDAMSEEELSTLASSESELLRHPLLVDQILFLREGELRAEHALAWAAYLRPFTLRYAARLLRQSASIAVTDRETRHRHYVLRTSDPDAARDITVDKIEDLTWNPLDVAAMFLDISYSANGSIHLDSGLGHFETILGPELTSVIQQAAIAAGYPTEWEDSGPPSGSRDDLDPETARQMASYFLLHGIKSDPPA